MGPSKPRAPWKRERSVWPSEAVSVQMLLFKDLFLTLTFAPFRPAFPSFPGFPKWPWITEFLNTENLNLSGIWKWGFWTLSTEHEVHRNTKINKQTLRPGDPEGPGSPGAPGGPWELWTCNYMSLYWIIIAYFMLINQWKWWCMIQSREAHRFPRLSCVSFRPRKTIHTLMMKEE